METYLHLKGTKTCLKHKVVQMKTETSLHFKKRRSTSIQTYMQIDHLPLPRDLIIVCCLLSGNKPTLGQRLVFCRAVVLNQDCVELGRLTVNKMMRQTISWVDFSPYTDSSLLALLYFTQAWGCKECGRWIPVLILDIECRQRHSNFFPNHTF